MDDWETLTITLLVKKTNANKSFKTMVNLLLINILELMSPVNRVMNKHEIF